MALINRLNDSGPGPLTSPPASLAAIPPYLDASGDLYNTAIDALPVVNYLNRQGSQAVHSVAARDAQTVDHVCGHDWEEPSEADGARL